MTIILRYLTIFLCFLPVIPVFAQIQTNDEQVYGLIEPIKLFPSEIQLLAKLDTGAKMSSLDARNIELYKQDGEQWAKFSIPVAGKKLKVQRYKVENFVKIKNRLQEAGSGNQDTLRPVIKMPICLGNQKKIIEINLQNRKNFLYHFLLGRDAIVAFDIVVDPSLRKQSKPKCK